MSISENCSFISQSAQIIFLLFLIFIPLFNIKSLQGKKSGFKEEKSNRRNNKLVIIIIFGTEIWKAPFTFCRYSICQHKRWNWKFSPYIAVYSCSNILDSFLFLVAVYFFFLFVYCWYIFFYPFNCYVPNAKIKLIDFKKLSTFDRTLYYLNHYEIRYIVNKYELESKNHEQNFKSLIIIHVFGTWNVSKRKHHKRHWYTGSVYPMYTLH